MSANTRQFLTFIVFTVMWSAGAGLILKTDVQPLAVFAVWLFGFVFGVHVIVTGKSNGFGYFLAIWLGPFAIIGALTLLATFIF